MRRKQRPDGPAIDASVGFAANQTGSGVAYAAVHDGEAVTLQRVPFRVKAHRGLSRREIGYAALAALARRLSERYAAVRFAIDDAALATDLSERRNVPPTLTIPYVALRCGLNRFDAATVVFAPSAETSDLSARALAEASLRVAA